jgi:hypothetical protein
VRIVLPVGCWPKGNKSSGRVATLKPLRQAFSTAFPLYRMKQLYRCDSVSRASSVESGWATRR